MTEAEFIALRLVFLSWLTESARRSGDPERYLDGIVLGCPDEARRLLPGDDNVVVRGDVMHKIEELRVAARDLLERGQPCER
jgi:hypothetical protein